jgi:phosphoribosylformimino-5-aminoimidazole carboxamide ribotide isomerase
MSLIIPAIDLQGGEAVRLFKGDYAQKTVYSNNPAQLAREFQDMGARYLHIVDLDGAKAGNTANLETIRAIRANTTIPLQLGGGIRTAETVALYLDEIKINRVILGTVALQDPAFLKSMLAKYGPEKIVVGVDVRNGRVSVAGWLQDSGKDYLEFISELRELGVTTIIATDISRDGTLTGPNLDLYSKIDGMRVIVSGGISCEQDILDSVNYYGVIVGKAHYEKKVDLKKILQRRIIPCLDIKNGRVVKGIQFEGLVDIGDPVEIAKKYQADGASEIVLLDITATTDGRETFYELLNSVSSAISIPITIGGGISDPVSIQRALDAGASKVSINSAAVKNPQLIADAAKMFGRSKIVIAVDSKKVNGEYKVFINGGTENTGLNLIDWIKQCEQLGAGELLPTSISGDGSQSGYDTEMTKLIVDNTYLPVIASGGCGEIADIVRVFRETNCHAALVASLVHFGKATINQIKNKLSQEGL